MLKFAYLAKKFPEFYAARKFAIVFTSTQLVQYFSESVNVVHAPTPHFWLALRVGTCLTDSMFA